MTDWHMEEEPYQLMEAVLLDRDIEEGKKRMTEDEAKDVLEYPYLFDYIAEQELSKKIEGERDNLKAILLTACGIFVENHQIASYNLCVNSESGAGKDFVVSNILKILPKQFVESRTRISPTAFTYWHNDPAWDWDGKVCYLQDISEVILNSEVFKVMVSEGSNATIVVEHKAKDIAINGKPVMIITTATANPKNELLRRFPILTLDESKEQTKAIMRRQSESAKNGLVVNGYNKPLIDSLAFLKREKVKIPFADIIDRAYPSDHIIMRTHYQRLLDLIKASCAFHQYQREKDLDGYLIAEPKDYDLAIIALRQTTQNALMIPLTKKQQKFLDLCKKDFEGNWFSAMEASNKCSFLSEKSVYNYLDKLQEYFFDTDSFDEEKSKKPVKKYRLKPTVNITIPTYNDCLKLTTITTTTTDTTDTTLTIDNNCNQLNQLYCKKV